MGSRIQAVYDKKQPGTQRINPGECGLESVGDKKQPGTQRMNPGERVLESVGNKKQPGPQRIDPGECGLESVGDKKQPGTQRMNPGECGWNRWATTGDSGQRRCTERGYPFVWPYRCRVCYSLPLIFNRVPLITLIYSLLDLLYRPPWFARRLARSWFPSKLPHCSKLGTSLFSFLFITLTGLFFLDPLPYRLPWAHLACIDTVRNSQSLVLIQGLHWPLP